MSSPIFLALRPKGPNFGAKVEAGPPSPPKTLILMYLISFGSTFGGIIDFFKNFKDLDAAIIIFIKLYNYNQKF